MNKMSFDFKKLTKREACGSLYFGHFSKISAVVYSFMSLSLYFPQIFQQWSKSSADNLLYLRVLLMSSASSSDARQINIYVRVFVYILTPNF